MNWVLLLVFINANDQTTIERFHGYDSEQSCERALLNTLASDLTRGMRELDIYLTGTCVQSAQEFAQQTQDWTLSIYRSGGTLLRLPHSSLEACLSAGGSYMVDETADRFDCGLNCEKSIDLSQAILCERVCNTGGCRE